MFSYIFMKVLESRPRRYDWGINLLTGGHAARIKDDIVANHIRSGMVVLDVGCGTGDLAVKAAQAGARVTGVDISEGMLAVAREKIKENGLESEVDLQHAGVVEMETRFDENSFDLITCILVISELYSEEREWTLRELSRILKSDGTLIIAGEVMPKYPFRKAIYCALRLPLALITYLISQTGTKAVRDISAEILKAGFEIVEQKKSFLGSFVSVVAKKSKAPPPAYARAREPEEDKSAAKTLLDYGGRWFPNPVEPGLRIIGTPDRTAPVIVTANFHLTVRRVEKVLAGQNCYLLVVPTKGINVWCASAGGEMNTHSIITALKTSGMGERVDHRLLVLPQLSAPGIDMELLRQLTGWNGIWGPAYARDLQAFLANGCTKTEKQCLVDFSLSFRIEMLLVMNVPLWLVWMLIALIFDPACALTTSAIFWGGGLVLYAGYPLLPFHSGWLKALMLTIIAAAVFTAVSVYVSGNPWRFSGWMVFASLSILSLGFDLKGIVGDRTSEAEALMYRLGFDSFGDLFRAEGFRTGRIAQDKSRCINCNTCRTVCPVGVYGIAADKRDVVIMNDSACLKCSACVRQCSKKALSLN